MLQLVLLCLMRNNSIWFPCVCHLLSCLNKMSGQLFFFIIFIIIIIFLLTLKVNPFIWRPSWEHTLAAIVSHENTVSV